MKSVEAFESITMLKNKFEEIKNNILRIEKEKNRNSGEFQYQKVTPSRFEYTRPASTSKLREYTSESLQESSMVSNYERTIDLLKQQIRDLQAKNNSQEQQIESLKRENSQLKSQLDDKVLEEKNTNKSRPQSCLRSSSSSPKKARVAFAKDLIKVKYISNYNNETPAKCEIENQVERPSDIRRVNRSLTTEFETPPKVGYYEKSMKSYLDEKRAQMNKLSSMNTENGFADYFRERSVKLWRQ
jgi:FtsZ-binding cell division protein ZapB